MAILESFAAVMPVLITTVPPNRPHLKLETEWSKAH